MEKLNRYVENEAKSPEHFVFAASQLMQLHLDENVELDDGISLKSAAISVLQQGSTRFSGKEKEMLLSLVSANEHLKSIAELIDE